MPVLLSNLEGIKKNFLSKDNDYLLTIVGREGSGKSTLGIKICRTIDPNFNIDRIVFSGLGFIKAILKAKPKEAILWDEAGEGGYSRDSMKRMNNLINKALMYSRAKQLFFVVIIPNFFMLDKFLRITRVGLMCYIKKRGNAQLYSNKSKSNKPSSIVELTIKGQRTYNMDCVRPDGYDTFKKLGNLYPEWGEDGEQFKQYFEKKMNFIQKFLKESQEQLEGESAKSTPHRVLLSKIMTYMTSIHSWGEISALVGMNEKKLKRIYQETI